MHLFNLQTKLLHNQIVKHTTNIINTPPNFLTTPIHILPTITNIPRLVQHIIRKYLDPHTDAYQHPDLLLTHIHQTAIFVTEIKSVHLKT